MVICDVSETNNVRTFDITMKNYNLPHIYICILPVEDAGGICGAILTPAGELAVIATIFCLFRLIYDAIAASSRLFLMEHSADDIV